jgi:AhpD family alkylhydroperoxidase
MTEFEEKLRQIVERGDRETAEEWLRLIEKEYGRTPLIFKRMAERPEVLISHLLYKGTVAETSALDPKYVELICLAVGAALKCPHCTGYHMLAAMKMGATREEILEVILLAGLISNSSVLANAYRIFDEKLAKCPPCEVEGMERGPDDAGPDGKTA